MLLANFFFLLATLLAIIFELLVKLLVTGNSVDNVAGNRFGRCWQVAGDVASDLLPVIGVHFCFGPCIHIFQ